MMLEIKNDQAAPVTPDDWIKKMEMIVAVAAVII